MAGVAGGEHAVEHVDAPGDDLDEAGRVTQSHEVTGLVGGQEVDGRRERLEHLIARLSHAQPTHCVSVEPDPHRAFGALGPQRCVDPSLHDPELALPLRRIGVLEEGSTTPVRPGGGPLDRLAEHLVGRRERRAHIEDHLDVSAEVGLHLRSTLRRQAVGAPVVRRPEYRPVVVDPGLQGEDLVATRVREGEAVPGGEGAEATEVADDVGAGPQHQVVRVGEHHLGTQVGKVRGRKVPHRPTGPHGHEAGGPERTAGRRHRPGTGTPIGGFRMKFGPHESPPLSPGATSMASPKERNRYPSASAVAYRSRQP